MDKNEVIRILMEKAKITREEAERILNKCDWDLLKAIEYLENQGKIKNESTNVIVEVTNNNSENENNQSDNKEYGGFTTVIGRIFRFIGRTIKKINKIDFEIKNEKDKPIKLPLTVVILLTLLLFVPTIILLTLGMFCDYRYSISYKGKNYNKVNNILDKIYKFMQSIKNDFKKGYQEKNV